jgi:phosphoribosyl-ATP pyrophosphohydrolase
MALTADQIAALSDLGLLAKISEESSEVIKAAMKHHAHGPRPSFAGVQYDNVADTIEEFSQLAALMQEYRRRFDA